MARHLKKVNERIKENYYSMTKSQKKLGEFIFENYREVVFMSMKELRDRLNVSDATIVRFARMIGYSGYNELKEALRKEINAYEAPHARLVQVDDDTTVSNDIEPIYSQVAKADITALENLYKNLDFQLLDAVVAHIYSARKIHIAALGADNAIGSMFEWYLSLMGFDAVCHSDGGFTLARRLSHITAEDLFIIFSSPRHLNIEAEAINAVKSNHVKVVGISSPKASDISLLCDILLPVEKDNNSFLNMYVSYIGLCNILLAKIYEYDKEKIFSKMQESSDFMDQFNLY